jgi:hypothetical protein
MTTVARDADQVIVEVWNGRRLVPEQPDRMRNP